ncbi:MAG: Mur ligase domain-containing protein, partial [Desulfovibrio sp.]|nr:Mur ligase domain-containing protein [Desulfovibrio sp.]
RASDQAPLSLKSRAEKRTRAAASPARGDASWESLWDHEPRAALFAAGAKADSRLVVPGDLFFCLPGNHADGHDYALDAARAGASAIVALRNPFLNEAGAAAFSGGMVFPPVFLADDVLQALWRLAMRHRDASLARVIGITGTAGKTSIKDVLAQVLETRARTERNPKNHNNQIGLPLSMLNASADASFWVMEVGISEGRDMDELGRILRPDIAVILNVGDAHIEGLNELGVAANKAKLLDYIQPSGVAVVSADYPDLNIEVRNRARRFKERGIELLRFSILTHDVFCRAEYEGPKHSMAGEYWISTQGNEYMLETPFRGEFGSENVAAIVTTATQLGLSLPELRHGFARASLPEQRFACSRYENFTIVDDSYNSNPLSAKRVVRTAQGMSWEYGLPLILVMGEMLELGDKAGNAHIELGAIMAEAKPELIFWKGGQVAAIRTGLRKALYQGEFYPVSGGQDFSLLLDEFALKRGLVLFKGSRANHMERLVDIFREWVKQDTAKLDATGDGDVL